MEIRQEYFDRLKDMVLNHENYIPEVKQEIIYDESTKSVRVSWEDCYDGRYKVRLEKEEYVKILEYFESFIKN